MICKCRKVLTQKKLNAVIKKIIQHRYFSVNFVKYLRTPILKNICKRLLLNRIKLIGNKTPRML